VPSNALFSTETPPFMPSPKPFPLTHRDRKVLEVILDKIEAFDRYNYPNKSVVTWISEAADMDETDVYYTIKHLRMARFV
jgi:hypothetical protein